MTIKKPPVITRDDAALIQFVSSCVDVAEEFETIGFSLQGAFDGDFCAIAAKLQANVGSLVLALPRNSAHVFVALTHGNTHEVARLLANVQDCERQAGRPVLEGEAIIFEPVADTADEAPCALLLLSVATSVDLARLPKVAAINGKAVHFQLVMLVTGAEMRIREQGGHDALMDHFAEADRSLLMFE